MSNFQNVMVDMETLDLPPYPVILSVGAVAFDPTSDAIGEKFYVVIDSQSAVNEGFTIGENTIDWWGKQNKDAQKILHEARDPNIAVPIREAFQRFTDWWVQNDAQYFWGNGAAFDNCIMAAAYRKLEMPAPWKFFNDRCFRTVKAMSDVEITRYGTYHNALDDAYDQVVCMQKIFGGRPE